MENKKYSILISFVLVVTLLVINFVSAEMLTSSANVSYDSEILGSFNESNWVKVIIDLKNISERTDLFSNFSDSEIWKISRWPSSDRIDAEITQEGFDKLINDSRVKSIYYDAPVHATNNEDKIKNETNDENDYLITIKPEVRDEKSKLIFWILMSIVIILVIVLILFKFKKD